ncbi:MAG: PQQ-binding-like beta-propeller repeat protein, partial [Methanospirillum sp.]|nr:PQQ-binding-like beta-propeller repeat protein [Methanospirillum sp.]
LDAENGKELWNFDVGWMICQFPAISDGVIYVGNQVGNFYAVDALNGKIKWQFDTGSGVSSPIISGDMVYITSGDGYLYALNRTKRNTVRSQKNFIS